MTGPTYYCWHCYAPLQEPSATCPDCGQSSDPPPGTDSLSLKVWALDHPLIERRMLALRALERSPAARARADAVTATRRLCHSADPYLAAAALRALHALAPDQAAEILDEAAVHGPAPVRHAARQLLASDHAAAAIGTGHESRGGRGP